MSWLLDYLFILKKGFIRKNTTGALYPLRAGLKSPAFYLLLQCHISNKCFIHRPTIDKDIDEVICKYF